jgi:hypothetical protein
MTTNIGEINISAKNAATGENAKISVVENITADSIDQIATHGTQTINQQYLIPENYFKILENALQEDSRLSTTSKKEKDSLLSKIKDLKNDPLISGISSGVIIEIGKKIMGFP